MGWYTYIVHGDREQCIELRTYIIITPGVMDSVVCLESLALAGREVSRPRLLLMNSLYRNTALELNLEFGHERVYRKLKKKMFSIVQWTIYCVCG